MGEWLEVFDSPKYCPRRHVQRFDFSTSFISGRSRKSPRKSPGPLGQAPISKELKTLIFPQHPLAAEHFFREKERDTCLVERESGVLV